MRMRELSQTNQRHEKLKFNRRHKLYLRNFVELFATKICGHYVVTLLNGTPPVFEWYMARLVVKNIHQ